MPKNKNSTKLQSNKKKLEKIHPLKQDDLKNIYQRIEMIDQETKKEKELFDIKVKSLKLEKVFLNKYLRDRMRLYKKFRK